MATGAHVKGYVTQLGFKAPLTIKCEDEMFMLKQAPAVKKSYASADIEMLLKDQATPQAREREHLYSAHGIRRRRNSIFQALRA